MGLQITPSSGGSGTAAATHVFSVMDYGAVHNGVTSDLTAVNAAIAAAKTAGGGDVYFPSGHYILTGSYNGTTNSLVTVPQDTNNYNGLPPRIRLVGESIGVTGPNNDTYEGGVVLDFTGANPGTGTYPFAISGAAYSEITDFTLQATKWNRVDLSVSNMTIWLPGNPSFGGVNLHNCMQGSIGDNVTILTKASSGLLAQPTNSNAIGVILPAHLNNVSDVFVGRNVTIGGFYDGLWTGEHAVLQRPYLASCVNGLRVRMMAHPTTGDVAIESCNRAIYVDANANACPVDLTVQGELNATGDWRAAAGTGAFLYDPTSKLRGQIRYELLSTAVGGFVQTLTYAEMSGGTGVGLTNLMANANNAPVSGAPVAKYDLADLTDAVGSNPLTDHGTVTFVTGKVGNAASLNGSSQYLTSNASVANGDFTVCGWVYITSAGSISYILSQWGDGASSRWGLAYAPGDSSLHFFPTSTGSPEPVVAMTTGAWHFFAVTWNNSTFQARLKVDNTGSWTTASGSAAMNTGGTLPQFSIGALINTSPTGYLNGKVDAVRLYTGVLSDASLTAIYNGGSGQE